MLLGKSSSKTVPPAMLSEFESGTVLSLSGTVLSLFGGTRGRGWWRSRGATEGEPLPPLASAASRRVGPCTRSVVQRSCTGGPGAASASVTPGLGVPGNLLRRISGVSRRADSERSGSYPSLGRTYHHRVLDTSGARGDIPCGKPGLLEYRQGAGAEGTMAVEFKAGLKDVIAVNSS